ncbi:MAG: hypothetical protein JWQ29_1242 [Phenylobacterium sp.]|nr:hypothetical protein [Phenylobacterium sp.]
MKRPAPNPSAIARSGASCHRLAWMQSGGHGKDSIAFDIVPGEAS